MKRKLVSIVLCLTLVLSTIATAFADTSQGTATTLRLEKTEGKVGITKTGGKSVTVKEGIRLYDGYEVKTDKNSKAYVSLDSSKAIMMDSSTDVTIKKSGKKLEIMLKSGTVLVNVEDKLAGDEEMNIRTTNSVTGIRGTILQASYIPQTGNTEIYLFEGKTTGKYLAPDGTWYTQELTTGSWLASGTGLLSDNPKYNGWTKVEGHWVYTNSKLDGKGTLCWSTEKGWYTIDAATGAEIKQDAWPFSFSAMPPQVQQEILNTPSMLERGQEHLDLYPELAEERLPETRVQVEKAVAAEAAAIEAEDAAIQEAYEKGNGGNTVDNLFSTIEPAIPTYAVRYYSGADKTELFRTIYLTEGEAIPQPDDLDYGYVTSDFQYRDPNTNLDTDIPATVGTADIDCWPTVYTLRQFRLTINNYAPASITVTAAEVSGATYDPNEDNYIITFNQEVDITPLMINAINYSITGGVTGTPERYYASNGGHFIIPVDTEGNITLNINDLGTTPTINTYSVMLDSVDLLELTSYEGHVLTITEPNDPYNSPYIFEVEGDEGMTFTFEGKILDGTQYGIKLVEVADPSAPEDLTVNDYDGFSGTYTITNNVSVETDEIYAITYAANFGFTVDDTWAKREGDTYYYVGTDEMTVTAAPGLIPYANYDDTLLILYTTEGETYEDSGYEIGNDLGVPPYVTTIRLDPLTDTHYDFYYNVLGYSTVKITANDPVNYTFTSMTPAQIADNYSLTGVDSNCVYNYYVVNGTEFAFSATKDPLAMNNVDINDRNNAAYPSVNDGDDYTVTVNEDLLIWINIAP